MTTYEIPLSASSQQFFISLTGVVYQITVTWRDAAQTWFFDMADASGDAILTGVPLVTGVDLLGQFKHLNLGGHLWCYTDGDQDAIPAYTNLGSSSHVLWTTN